MVMGLLNVMSVSVLVQEVVTWREVQVSMMVAVVTNGQPG